MVTIPRLSHTQPHLLPGLTTLKVAEPPLCEVCLGKGNKSSASFSRELDFGTALQEGYFPYDGPKPLVDTLIKNLVHVSSKPAFVDSLDGEKERNARAKATTYAAHTILV